MTRFDKPTKMKNKIIFFLRHHPKFGAFISTMSWIILPSIRDTFRKKIEESYCSLERNTFESYTIFEKIDMLYWQKIWFFDPLEYVMYDFRSKGFEERTKFIGMDERAHLLNKLNTKEYTPILANKYQAYKTLQNFYGRKVTLASSDDDLNRILENKTHSKAIIKPLSSTKGHGIFIVSDIEEEKKLIQDSFPCVIEDVIEQAPSMAIFHPQSINTIRFVTYFDGEKMHRIFAIIRIGRGGSHIDNTSAGGISAVVDVDNGCIITNGKRRHGETYANHPDSGVPFRGYQIERWQELITMLESLVRVIPQIKFVGWDLALTNNGWVVVEGNTKPSFVGYQSQGYGLRDKLKSLKLL